MFEAFIKEMNFWHRPFYTSSSPTLAPRKIFMHLRYYRPLTRNRSDYLHTLFPCRVKCHLAGCHLIIHTITYPFWRSWLQHFVAERFTSLNQLLRYYYPTQQQLPWGCATFLIPSVHQSSESFGLILARIAVAIPQNLGNVLSRMIECII